MCEPTFDFVEVIRPDRTVIEVRDRATGKVHAEIEPDLFAYMVERAWREAAGHPEDDPWPKPS